MPNSTARAEPPPNPVRDLPGVTMRRIGAGLLLAVSFAVLYRDVIGKLVYDWANDDNYSHGFVIAPLALYFAWERRRRLLALGPQPSVAGAAIVAIALGLLAAGTLGAELFLTRVSLIVAIVGAIVFIAGWRHLRVLAFPVAFLLLMVPPPAIIFNQIALPLQLLASRAAAAALTMLHIPVLREGNVIVLAHTTLQVVEACSGIRSLVSLLTLGTVYGYFADSRPGVRLAIALSTIPIAIGTNAVRVAGTGIAAHYVGARAAEGFFHSFSGWVMFAVAFAAMPLVRLLIVAAIRIAAPRAPRRLTPREVTL